MAAEREQRIVELIVDASGTVAGMQAAGSAYDHFGDRAAMVEQKVAAYLQRQSDLYLRVPRSIDGVTRSYENLQAKLDPVFHTQLRMEREMTKSLSLINQAVLTGVTTEQQANKDILLLKQQQVEAINRVRDAQLAANNVVARSGTNNVVATPGTNPMMHGANDNLLQNRRQNLNYQLFDIGQSAYGGMGLGMIAAQQGPQIAQLYASQGGLNAAMKDFGNILGTVVRVAVPVGTVLAGIYGAYRLIGSYSVEATLAIDDNTRALAEQAASWRQIEGQVSQLSQVQKTYNDVITDSARAHSDATTTIIANTEREFNAKKALLELEAQRQQASIALQQSEIAIAGHQVRRDITAGDPGDWYQPFDSTNPISSVRMNLEARGMADPRIGSVPFVRIPEEISGVQQLQADLENNPAIQKLKEMRANLELTEIAAEKMRKALLQTFDVTAGGTVNRDGEYNQFVPLNPAVPTADPRRSIDIDTTVKKDSTQREDRLRQLRQEHDLLGMSAGAAAKLRFEQDALNDAVSRNIDLSGPQREAIRRQADEYGLLTLDGWRRG
ncbi:hypothetical protein [Pararhizobium gei]|uniref:hypothetical protein n=1 Tax=Pararhizobium gei TaxID=1395951 RepID=UPI0023DA9884|nr:hypothetical protein [Rhizobium gei]